MSSTYKSSVSSNLKPRNIFYVWYTELCRRANMSPLAAVKPPKPKNDTVLDFVADRIKPEEWTPILNALSVDTSLHVIAIRSRTTGCYFHHEINNEEKLRRMKKKCGSLWTDYILRSLSTSLALCVKSSQVLSCLELHGLPLSMEYLEILLSSLRANKTVKILSLKHCAINDGGCQLVCTNVRLMPSISVLNLSACNLSSLSGQYIAKVINHQQLNRYSESWHNSLRYEEPENNAMGGIKRITLDNNPNLGDEGTVPILDALDDDLWIKAIDMQNCGVTENLSTRIIRLVTRSNSLEVADFRNNEGITAESVERIFEAFQRRYKADREPEFLWVDGSSSLHEGSTYGSRTTLVGTGVSIQKARSAPLRNFSSSDFAIQRQFRRTKTLSNVECRSRFGKFMSQNSSKELVDVKRQLMELQTLLSQETSKRIETEKINNELQKQIGGIRHMGSLHKDGFLIPEKLAKVVRGIEDLNRNATTSEFSKHTTNSQVKHVPEKVFSDRIKSAPKPAQCPKQPDQRTNLVINLRSQSSKQNLSSRNPTPSRLKSKNVPSVMSPILEVSTPSKPIEKLSAAQIFEQMILKQDYDSYILQERNRKTTLEYCCDIPDVGEVKLKANDCNLSSGSDSSLDMLYREMEEIDQNFSLNCSKSSRSTLIERSIDCGAQHFRMPIRSVSLTPS